jgi:2-methylcitrate dehydratase PrpD
LVWTNNVPYGAVWIKCNWPTRDLWIDYDDTHVGGIVHPSAAVVSLAVTVGEYVKASEKEILEAIIAGWEIIIRLALAAIYK